MAVPSNVNDLSSTISSNSPAGADFINSTLDDYLRAHAGIVRQESLNKAWVPFGQALTFISASSFSVVAASGDESVWYAGRAIKATCTAGTIYGVITTTSQAVGVVTVNVITAGGLDSGLSRIDLACDPMSLQPMRNWLINPWFRFWQRNTTFTTGAGTATNVADGWAVDPGAAGIVTFSQQSHALGQTSVPFEPQFFARYNQSTGGTTPLLKQRIEDVRTLAGRNVCVAVLAKVSAATLSVTPRITQYFGTGGGASANVTATGTAWTLTTSWQLFYSDIFVPSISGKTLGVTDTYTAVRAELLFPDASTFTMDIAAMWVVDGSVPVFFPPRPFDEELRNVQRRYFKTFLVDQVPIQNVGNVNTAAMYNVSRAGANAFRFIYQLPVPIRTETRTSQTFTGFSPLAAASTWYNNTGGAVSGASTWIANHIATNAIVLSNAQLAADAIGDLAYLHFTLDSEFAAAT